jgi:Tetracyclin repressor-like, C-terminal domain
MRAVVFRPMATPTGADDSWDGSIRATLRAYRDAFAAHPRLIPLLTAQTVSAPNVMQIYDDLAAALSAAGLPEDRLLDVITVLDSFVIGSALDLVTPDEVWNSTLAGTPQLASAIRAAPAGRARADRAFDLGITLLLGGMAELLDRGSH